MRGLIKIGDREIEMAANAASPFIYSKIFQEDFEQNVESVTSWRKMTYVMVKQAELGEKELLKGTCTEEDFIDWLIEFEPMDFVELMEKATDLYMKQKEPKSVPKNQAG